MVCHVFLCLALAYLFMRTEVQDTAQSSRSQRVRIGGHETGKDSIWISRCGSAPRPLRNGTGLGRARSAGFTLIPYCSNSVAKPRSSFTRRTSAGASSLGHRICRMWEACSKLPFIHDLRGRRTGRSSTNGAPATSYRPLKWPKDFSVTPSIPTFFSIVGSGPYNLP